MFPASKDPQFPYRMSPWHPWLVLITVALLTQSSSATNAREGDFEDLVAAAGEEPSQELLNSGQIGRYCRKQAYWDEDANLLRLSGVLADPTLTSATRDRLLAEQLDHLNPWRAGRLVSRRTRIHALLRPGGPAGATSIEPTIISLKERVEAIDPTRARPELAARINAAFAGGDTIQKQDQDASLAQAAAVCLELTWKLPACLRSVRELVERARPNSQNVMLPKLWTEAVSKAPMRRALKLAALQVLERIERLQAWPQRASTEDAFDRGDAGDLFTDLQMAFRRVPETRAEARDSAWNVLALLATGGANTAKRLEFMGVDDDDLHLLLRVLGSGALVLDADRVEHARPLYSAPQAVALICDTGKTYHFWMTAYLAREAAKLVGDSEAAAAAAFSMQKGYQFLSASDGRDRAIPFTSPRHTPYLNNIRIDLVGAAAGAWFGARDGAANGFRLSRSQYESTLVRAFERSEEIEKRPIDEINRAFRERDPVLLLPLYVDWTRALQPNLAFEVFARESSMPPLPPRPQ